MNTHGHPQSTGTAPVPAKLFTGGCGEDPGCAILTARD
jgi:hypothetical protein